MTAIGKLSSRFGLPSLLAASLIVAPGVQAGEVPSEAQPGTTPLEAGEFSVTLDGGIENRNLSELFNRAFNHHTGTFYDITDILGQVNTIFGARSFPGSFLDNQIAKDGKLVGTLFYYFLSQEMAKPTIRTQDLPSPYNTSIHEDPSLLVPR